MRKLFSITLLGASLLGIPMLTGCDDKTKTTQTDVKTNPNGSYITIQSAAPASRLTNAGGWKFVICQRSTFPLKPPRA